jgi:hypothetical protein
MTMDVELSFPLLLGCYFVSLREICFLSICLSVNDTLLRLHSLFCLQHTASSCFSAVGRSILQEGENGHVKPREGTLLCFAHLMADG